MQESNEEKRKFLAPYIETGEASRANIRDYGLFKHLASTGKLRTGLTENVLARLGISEVGRNVETQIADKLAARLAQNVGSAFGGKSTISNYFEQTFQKSIPNLKNTPEGIIALSELNEIADQINLLREDAAIKAVEENGSGALSPTIAADINKKISKEIDKLENRALDIAKKAVRSTQKLVTIPDASGLPNGTLFHYQNGSTDEVINGKWVRKNDKK